MIIKFNKFEHIIQCPNDKSEKEKFIRRPVRNHGRIKERACRASARGANL